MNDKPAFQPSSRCACVGTSMTESPSRGPRAATGTSGGGASASSSHRRPDSHPVSIFGVSLPIILETETLRPYETETAVFSQQQRQTEMQAVLEAYLHSLVDPYGTVTATEISSRLRGDILTVTLTAECREELGKTVPIYTANEPDGTSG